MWRAQRSHSPQNLPGDAQLVVFEVFTELAQIVEIGDFFPKLVTKKEKRQKKIEKQKNIRGQERGRVGGGVLREQAGSRNPGANSAGVFHIKEA